MQSKIWGKAIEPFLNAGWPEHWLMPLIPPDAKLTPGSKLSPKMLGKIPGEFRGSSGWAGRRRWTEDEWDDAKFARAKRWPTDNAGVYAKEVQALDCDISDPDLSERMRKAVNQILGEGAYRTRSNSARWARPVRGMPAGLAAMKLMRGETPIDKLEFKASGHWVVTGQHKAGDHYVWLQGVPAQDEVAIWPENGHQRLLEALQVLLTDTDVTVQTSAPRRRSDALHRASLVGGGRRRTEDLPELLSLGMLERLLEALECNRETVGDHDEAVKVYAGFAGVLGRAGWPDPPAALVAWAASYGDRSAEDEEDWLRERWASFVEVTNGAAGFRAWLKRLVAGGVLTEALAAEVIEEVRQAEAREAFDDVSEEGETFDQLLQQAVQGYVYRNHRDEWMVLKGMIPMTPRQFDHSQIGSALRDACHAAEPVTMDNKRRRVKQATEIVKPHAQFVSDVTYLPGGERFLPVRDDLPMLNRWSAPARPFEGQVITDDMVQPYLRALDHVFDDEPTRQLFLDHVSHLAQNPGVKIEWCMLLFSETQGTGKDSLLQPVRIGAVGVENWSVVQLQDLQSAYNGQWAESQVVLVIELPGGHRRDVIEIMKGHIASVAGDRTVNPKYVTPYRVPDRISWIATTNHPDAVDFTEDDRRFAVLQTRETSMAKALSDELHSFYDEPNNQRGLHLVGEWLRQRTISANFDPKRCPLPSLAKQTMQRNGLAGRPAEQLYERLTHDDAQGSLAHRTLIWHREVQQIIQGAHIDSRWKDRKGQTELAMRLAGWQWHARSGADGRMQIRASRGEDGKRPATTIKIWSRADDQTTNSLSARDAAKHLLTELQSDQSYLVEDLKKLLEPVGESGETQ
jgi:hypothetical protein